METIMEYGMCCPSFVPDRGLCFSFSPAKLFSFVSRDVSCGTQTIHSGRWTRNKKKMTFCRLEHQVENFFFFTAAVTNSTFLTIPEAGRAANVLGFVHSQMTCPLPLYPHLCFSSLWFPHWPVKELPQPRNPKCDYQDNSAHTRRFSII